MPKAVDVKPERWSNIIVLFDDGTYSAIWGNYDKSENRVLGVRWNGNETITNQSLKGFPTSRGRPVWHVEVSFLTLPIIHKFLEEVVQLYDANQLSEEDFRTYKHNMMVAIKENLCRPHRRASNVK